MSYQDLIKHASEGNAADFGTEFESMMGEKVTAALDARTKELATTMYANDSKEGMESDEDV